MNKYILSIMITIMLLITGCTQNTVQPQEESKTLILTTFYPVEEITKAIVKDTADVKVLIKAGVEPHSYEPTPMQIVELSKADVFVTMEGIFEHVEEEIIESKSDIKIIKANHNLELIKEDEHEGEYDPHVWLSIHNMKIMTNEISQQLINKYPQNKELYEQNTKAYLEKLEALENEYQTKLVNCKKEEIIVNHKAFGYLAHEYNFRQISVAGFSPESEPSPKTIKNVIDEAKEHELKYVFSEGQLDTKTAQTIANDIGGEVLELNPIKLNNNQDYFSIMRKNLDNLVKGLECSIKIN